MYTVEQVRVGLNITQLEMAKKLGIHVNSYRNKIEGKTKWFLDEAILIAELSGHNLNQISFTK